MARLATCQWVREHHDGLIPGPIGSGKPWLGWALGHQACREGLTGRSLRLPRFLQELPSAKGEGRYGTLMPPLAKTDVRIRDDWGLAPCSAAPRCDGREIVADRHDCRATRVTRQLPVAPWHEARGEPTLADAILDRLVHHASKITLQGESMRTRPVRLTSGATAAQQDTAQRR